jgi:hypothetical protein
MKKCMHLILKKKVMKKHNVLVGFMERMEEFLVQLRHRVGWKDDMRNILHYNHKRSSSSSSSSSSSAPIRTKYHIPDEFLNLMNEQDYVTTEMDFHSSVRLLYLDQVPQIRKFIHVQYIQIFNMHTRHVL